LSDHRRGDSVREAIAGFNEEYMAIEPIGSVGGVALPVIPAEFGHLADGSAAQLALAQALAKESQTIEQRANDGDPIALAQLAEDEKRLIPIDSQQLLPPPLEHPTGAHEPGKGILIDIYD
jgi:hypothetical protein